MKGRVYKCLKEEEKEEENSRRRGRHGHQGEGNEGYYEFVLLTSRKPRHEQKYRTHT